MPKKKDLKRQVRDRMTRTGESYTAARAQVVRSARDERVYAEIAGMSDAAVEKKTGRDWRGWVKVLDDAKATSKPHREIAKWLRDEEGVDAWWAQSVTVGYERIRGLRDEGQRRGGKYDANKSKTFPVPLADLYAAFDARRRSRWLGGAKPRVKKATPGKSIRWTWDDGTPVDVYFWEKGPAKSQVQLQHRELPDKAAVERVKAEWTERLAALGELLA